MKSCCFYVPWKWFNQRLWSFTVFRSLLKWLFKWHSANSVLDWYLCAILLYISRHCVCFCVFFNIKTLESVYSTSLFFFVSFVVVRPGEGHGDASSAPAVRPSEMRQPHPGSQEAQEQLADHLCPLRVSGWPGEYFRTGFTCKCIHIKCAKSQRISKVSDKCAGFKVAGQQLWGGSQEDALSPAGTHGKDRQRAESKVGQIGRGPREGLREDHEGKKKKKGNVNFLQESGVIVLDCSAGERLSDHWNQRAAEGSGRGEKSRQALQVPGVRAEEDQQAQAGFCQQRQGLQARRTHLTSLATRRNTGLGNASGAVLHVALNQFRLETDWINLTIYYSHWLIVDTMVFYIWIAPFSWSSAGRLKAN